MELQNTEEDNKVFNDLQTLRNSLNPNNPVRVQKEPGEDKILENMFAIEAINKRMKVLEEQVRTHPLDFMSVLVWEVQLDKLANDAERLQKQNQKLSQSFNQSFPASPHSLSKPFKKVNPSIGYAPISLSSLAPNFKTDFELKEIQNKLDEVYERKDALFMEIQNSATGIADPRIQKELDSITRLEASLLSQAEDIRLSKEADALINTLKFNEERSRVNLKTDKTIDTFNKSETAIPNIFNEQVISENGKLQAENNLHDIALDEPELSDALDEIRSIRENLDSQPEIYRI